MPSPRRQPVRPARVVVIGFLLTILVGTALLSAPIAHAPGQRLGLIDALFMATSAVCVTGLSVIDVGTELSPFGQVVLALLVKVGGFGILTMGALVALATGRRLGVVDRLRLQTQMNHGQVAGVVRLARTILIATTAVELVGALALLPSFARDHGLPQGAVLALFHAVSAWNNAGFSLLSEGLAGYAGDLWLNLVVIGLFVGGGLGLVVIVDVISVARARIRRGRPWRGVARVPWTLHTRLALSTTAVLAVVGVLGILALEWNNPATLGAMPPGSRWLGALFHGLAPRSSGFNTLEVGAFGPATVVLTMMLMFVGGNPSSTAGGIKTTTIAVLALSAWAVARGRAEASAFGRTLAEGLIVRAATVATLATVGVATAVLTLNLSDPDLPFLGLAFEAVSAFATVGLSTGITAQISDPGRMVLIAAMFIGRIGLITFALALVEAREHRPWRYPEEDVVVG